MVKVGKRCVSRAPAQNAQQLPGWARLREIAVKARVDPRTVRKELLTPGSVKSDAGNRVREVLALEAAP